MRPSPILLGALAGALATSAVTPARAQVADRLGAVEAQAGGGSFSWSSDDRDRAVLGISLGSGGRGDTLGVRVLDVVSGGPADKAGVEEGDRITSINVVPRVLPWRECPNAIASAQGVVGLGLDAVVNKVLADYRGYDTLGETTVIFTAGIGVLLLLHRARRRGRANDAENGQ